MSSGAEEKDGLSSCGRPWSVAKADIIAGEKPSSVNGGQDKHRLRPTVLAAVDRTMDISYVESLIRLFR